MLRRRFIAQVGQWDIILYGNPNNKGAVDEFLVVPPSTATGFVIAVDITRQYKGYVYDARGILPAMGYVNNQPFGYHFIDKSTIFKDYGVMGTTKRLKLSNSNFNDACHANYLKLRWCY